MYIKNRKLHILFGIVSLLIIIWTMVYSFTNGFNYRIMSYHSNTGIVNNPISRWQYSWPIYFTNISNLIFAIVTFSRGIFYKKKYLSNNLQFAACVYMIIVGMIYWPAIGLVDIIHKIKYNQISLTSPNWFLMFMINNLLVHFTTVIFAVVLIIIILRKKQKVSTSIFWKFLIYPFCYYIFAWILYLVTWKIYGHEGYIYSFLNFFHPYGVTNIFLIILIDISFALIIILIVIVPAFILYKNGKQNNIIEQSQQNDQKLMEDKIRDEKVSNDYAIKQENKNSKKPKITKTKSNQFSNKYIIQKSTKTKGWELKKVGAKRATFTSPTKAEVQEKYKKYLKANKGTILTEKGRHGKIRTVKKRKK